MLRSLAPMLGCGLMMLVCVAVMAGGHSRRNEPTPPASADETAELRDEVARLRRLDDQQRAAAEDPGP